MKIKTLLMCAVAGIGIAASTLPSQAFAAAGWAAKSVNLRAGPDRDYPVVSRLPANALVEIEGCVGGFTWCDVHWKGLRGWMSGKFLQTDYRHRRVFIVDQGPVIGLPLLTFDIGSYWDDYYRGQPWYNDRPRYVASHHLDWHDDHAVPAGRPEIQSAPEQQQRWHGPHDPEWHQGGWGH